MAESKVGSNPMSKKEAVTTVIAMDGSEFSNYALTFYMECLHKPGNHTILAHTAEHKGLTKPLTGNITDVTAHMAEQIKEEEAKATEFVEHLTKRLKDLEIDGSIERIQGDPGLAIINLAKEKKADFIIVGCRGTGTTRKTFTGSVTDYVAHHSHVPVLIARNSEHLEKLRHHGKEHVKTHKKHDEQGVQQKHDVHEAQKKHDEHVAHKKQDNSKAHMKHDENKTQMKHDKNKVNTKHDEHEAQKKHGEHKAHKKQDEHGANKKYDGNKAHMKHDENKAHKKHDENKAHKEHDQNKADATPAKETTESTKTLETK